MTHNAGRGTIAGAMRLKLAKPFLTVGVASLLLIAGCEAPDESVNISEDQLNHFAGITVHDHNTASTPDRVKTMNATPSEPSQKRQR